MPGKSGAIEALHQALNSAGCDPLPNNWLRRLAIEKRQDEEIVWAGRPGNAYGKTEQAAWLSGIALVFYLGVRSSEIIADFVAVEWSNWFIPILSLVCFVALLFFGWLMKRLDSSNSLYVLTNQRALLMRFGVFFRIRSFPIADVRKLTRFELEDGSGDLVFERFALKDEDGNLKTGENGFYGIADVRQVEKKLQALIETKESLK